MKNEIIEIEEYLLKKVLVTYPIETEICQIFAKFVLDHPEIDPKSLHTKVIQDERIGNPHYGNEKSPRRTLVIYSIRKETQEEHDKRIESLCKNFIDSHIVGFRNDVSGMINESWMIPAGKKEDVVTSIKEEVNKMLDDSLSKIFV